MATGSSSTERGLLIAIEILGQCISDPECQIQEADRNNLINKFLNELQRRFHTTLSQHISFASDITIGDGKSSSSAKQISELIKILNECWMPQRDESHQRPGSSGEVEQVLQQHLPYFLIDKVAEMTETQLIYWWVGQGLIKIDDGEDAKDAAGNILRQLVDEGALEQVISSRKKLKLRRYKLIMRSSEMQQPIKDDKRVGMLRKEGTKLILTYPDGTSIDKKSKGAIESIETLLNLDAPILNIDIEWLQKMKNLKVLHLGRWSDEKKHMEVETVEFLQAFKNLKKLRYISFKGLSRIMKLDEEICSLGNSLRVLDLQDCPNLEMLPKGIQRLKNLTHLDLSECFLLDRIPKGIVALAKLQVLKGFVITDVQTSSSCKFKDLANYLGKTLKKLSIRTRRMSFPTEDELDSFVQFEKLVTLKVAWVKVTEKIEEKGSQTATQEETFKPKEDHTIKRVLAKTFSMAKEKNSAEQSVLENLQKLEVEAIPQKAVNSLLLRDNKRLQNLRKLHILGGKVSNLTNHGKIKWKEVEALKLKYLGNLHMNWMQLKASFPKVNHLEMVQCPNLTFFPCDHNGIWGNVENV